MNKPKEVVVRVRLGLSDGGSEIVDVLTLQWPQHDLNAYVAQKVSRAIREGQVWSISKSSKKMINMRYVINFEIM